MEKFLSTYFYGFLPVKFSRLLRCLLVGTVLCCWFTMTLAELITFIVTFTVIAAGVSYILEPFFKKK